LKGFDAAGGTFILSQGDVPLDASLRILERFGIKVHRQKHLKLHAKLLLADGERALVGSMNIDRSAFDLRRELGIIVDDEPIVERLAGVFERDWDRSHRWEAPDPLEVEKHDHDELPHDPHFIHE
jgi:phosphatidylserine/phosphatidylglycerophosphate/cardiolipin synthase-like enzyme